MGPSFWLENICDLFSTPSLVPLKTDSLEDQMNATTRIVIVAFVLCGLFSIYVDYRFLLGALFLIILVYYALRSFRLEKETKEEYGLVEDVVNPVQPVPWPTGTNEMVIVPGPTYPRRPCGSVDPASMIDAPPPLTRAQLQNPQLINAGQSLAWCPQDVPLEDSISDNQRLVGPPNPKTRVRPVIPTPIYDFEVWKPNDFVIPTGVNEQKRQELFDNGYTPVARVNNNNASMPVPPTRRAMAPPQPERIPVSQVESEEHYQDPRDGATRYKEFSYPSIDTACGFDPTNLEYGLPVNYKANECQKTPEMKRYNDDLFTIPLQPGLYTKSQVNQPYASQSNLGISMTQPFLPVGYQHKDGYSQFVELANPMAPAEAPFPRTDAPLRSEIYDPRLTGYGTSYRSYIEPVTGQPRFYYDDIDQQTQYNYISRNNIDFAAFGTRTGPINNRSLEGDALTGYADEMYTNSQIGFRNEMQQRLMHKNSNREWQRRIAPISTRNTARATGGTASSGAYAGPRG